MADKGTTMVKPVAIRIKRVGNEHAQHEKKSKKEYLTSGRQNIQRNALQKPRKIHRQRAKRTLPPKGRRETKATTMAENRSQRNGRRWEKERELKVRHRNKKK